MSESRAWDAFKLFVGLIVPVAAFLVAYSAYLRSPTLEKHLDLSENGPFNLQDYVDLYGNPDKLTLSQRFNGKPVSNLSFIHATLANSGTTPIEKADYSESIAVSVKPPWKIISVETWAFLPSAIQLHWQRVSDQRYEADPVLFNPRDSTVSVIYVTNTQPEPAGTKDKAKPQLEWHVRIKNLPALGRPPSITQKSMARMFGITVELTGWSTIFVVVAALVFEFLYLHFLGRSGLVQRWGWGWRTIGAIVASSLVSFSAAECGATYIWGNLLTDLLGVDHWLNAPPLIIHVVALVTLWRMATRRRPDPTAAPL